MFFLAIFSPKIVFLPLRFWARLDSGLEHIQKYEKRFKVVIEMYELMKLLKLIFWRFRILCIGF
jgi:hypothetical protein